MCAVTAPVRMVAADWLTEHGDEEAAECVRSSNGGTWALDAACPCCLGILRERGKHGEALADELEREYPHAARLLMPAFRMTYSRYRWADEEDQEPEEDHGWYQPGGWEFPNENGVPVPPPNATMLVDMDDLRFQDHHDDPAVVAAVATLREYGCDEPSSNSFHPGIWWSSVDDERDPSDGSVFHLAVHFEGMTDGQERAVFEAMTSGRPGFW